MKSLIVTPNKGIGSLKLGMSPEQILDAINQMISEFKISSKHDMQISMDKEEGSYSLRYISDAYFFMVRYQDNQAIEISVDRELSEQVKIILYDMDVFHTQVEQLVTFLKQYSDCSYDLEDEQLSTDYEFDNIGIRLWREEPFHPKLLANEAYRKEMELVIEEMYQYLYFNIVAVKKGV